VNPGTRQEGPDVREGLSGPEPVTAVHDARLARAAQAALDSLPQHRPGILRLRMLYQREIWIDREGHEHRIADMSEEHLTRVLWMLRDRADTLYWAYLGSEGRLDGDNLPSLHETREWIDSSTLSRCFIDRLGPAADVRPGPRL
jgi:hypothetical protein